MAKKAILDVLESTIGKYVRNLDAESLNVAVWSGKIELHSLELNTGAVNAELDRQAAEAPNLALPFCVIGGSFESLQVDVPWARLSSRPVVMRAKGLKIFVEAHRRRTKLDNLADVSEQKRIARVLEERLNSIKIYNDSRLQANALSKLAKVDDDDDEDANKTADTQSTFTGRLVRRIVENIQVDIDDVHVAFKGSGSAAGIVLRSFSLVTTDKDGNRSFVDRTAVDKSVEGSFLYKVLVIQGFGIYLDEEHAGLSRPITISENRALTTEPEHDWILSPLSFNARLHQSDNAECVDFPKYLLSSELAQLSILLSRTQLELAHKIAEKIKEADNMARPLFPQYRPLARISKKTAKQWWQYAFRSVSRLNGSRSWMEFWEAFKKRRAYISLYKRATRHEECPWMSPLSEDEKSQLEVLEQDRTISVQGLMAWRNIADAQVEKEKAKHDETKKKRSSQSSYFSYVFGSKEQAGTDGAEPPITLTAEEMKELEAVSLEKAADSELSNDSKLCDIKFTLGSFKVNLTTYGLRPLAALKMGTVRASFDANADGSFTFDFNLSSLSIQDMVTPGSLYPTVFRNLAPTKTNTSSSDKSHDAFELHLDKTRTGDQTLILKLVAFETVGSPILAVEMKRFLTFKGVVSAPSTPRSNPMLRQSLSGSVDLFYDADGGPEEKITRDTHVDPPSLTAQPKVPNQLSSAMAEAWKNKMKEKSKLTLDCDIRAPVLILPEDCQRLDASVMMFDLGHFRLEYGRKEAAKKVSEWFLAQPRRHIGDVLMDSGVLSVENLTFTVGKTNDVLGKANVRRSADEIRSIAVIEPFSARLDLGVENHPGIETPRVATFGVFPSLSLRMTPTQGTRAIAVLKVWKNVFQNMSDPTPTEQGISIMEEQPEADRPESLSLTTKSSVPPRRMSKLSGPNRKEQDANMMMFHFVFALQRFSLYCLSDEGDGMEMHLVSASTTFSQFAGGATTTRVCMGWFWVLDRLKSQLPRHQRLIVHSNLPQPASLYSEESGYNVLDDLEKAGVFGDEFSGSSELADVRWTTTDPNSSPTDPFELTDPTQQRNIASMVIDAKFSSLYIHWNPQAIKATVSAYNYVITSIKRSGLNEKDQAMSSKTLQSSRIVKTTLDAERERAGPMFIQATMENLELSLNSARDDLPLFVLNMTGTKIVMLSSGKNMRVSMNLGDVRVSTPGLGATLDSYRTILGLAPGQTESLMTVHYYVGASSLKPQLQNIESTTKCEAYADIQISPMRFVYIQGQVMTLVEFATEGILGAITAQAAVSAANAAKEIASSGEEGEKIFAVKAVGIDVIMPQAATKNSNLKLKAGNLKVVYHALARPGGGKASLALTDVTFMDGKAIQMVEQPLCMTLDVDLPPEGIGSQDDQAMRVNVGMSKAGFLLSKPHYSQIMQTLDENIGQLNPHLRPDDTDDFRSPTIDKNADETLLDNFPVASMTHAGVQFVERQRRMFIDVNVEVLSLGICNVDLNDPICRVAAVKTSICLKFLSDQQQMITQMTLHDLVCDDRRIKSSNRQFRSLVEQVTSSEQKHAQDVFFLSYLKDSKEKKSEYELKVGAPQLVFIPDAISAMLDFVDIAADRQPQPSQQTPASEGLSTLDVKIEHGDGSIETSVASEISSISVKASTADCRIVMVDLGTSDSSSVHSARPSSRSQNANVTESIVVQGHLDSELTMIYDVTAGRTLKTDFQLHGTSCEVYTAHSRHLLSPLQIVEPTSFAIFYSMQSANGKPTEYELRTVTMSALDVTFSMQNAALLTTIMSSLRDSVDRRDNSDREDHINTPLSRDETARIEELASALESSGDQNRMDTSQLVRVGSILSSDEPSRDSGGDLTSSSQWKVRMTLPETTISVVNDLQGLDDALFRIKASNFVAGGEAATGAFMGQLQTTFDGHINSAFSADYFDSRVNLWRRLLIKPWELTMKGSRGVTNRFSSRRLSTVFDVESFPCHISISEQFLGSLSGANSMWAIYSTATNSASTVLTGESGPSSDMERKALAASAARNLVTSLPYAIENYCGMDIEFTRGKDQSPEGRQVCSSGTIEYFRFEPPRGGGYGGRRLYGQEVTERKTVTLCVGSEVISIEHIDNEIGMPRHAHNLKDGVVLITFVTKEAKSTVLHVGSHVQLENKSIIPMKISVSVGNVTKHVGICRGKGSSAEALKRIPPASSVSTGRVSKPSRSFGIPIDLLGFGEQQQSQQISIMLAPLLPGSEGPDQDVIGVLPVSSIPLLIMETAGERKERVADVTCTARRGGAGGEVLPDPFVVQVRVKTWLVSPKNPFVEIWFEPRAKIENKLPVSMLVRTPMPHTFATKSKMTEISARETIHTLRPNDTIEVFTPGPSVAIGVRCMDKPIGGVPTGWMQGGWVDLPMISEFRLVEPVRCKLPFVQNNSSGYASGDVTGSEFFVVEATDDVTRLDFDQLGARPSQSEESGQNDGLELVAPKPTGNEMRMYHVTVSNYGVDHTGGMLFEQIGGEGRRRSLRSSQQQIVTPFSAFSSWQHGHRITLLPGSNVPLRVLHLTMDGREGMKRSIPFCVEDISICEGGIESTGIGWEDTTPSGFFAYRRLVGSYQSEIHIIPEFIVYNGSKNHQVAIRQVGSEVVVEPGKMAPVTKHPKMGLVLSLDYFDLGVRAGPLHVDELQLKVAIVKSIEGSPLGSVAVQTVIGTVDSRLVVKLGEVQLGETMQDVVAMKDPFERDMLRLRVRWSELMVTLNETKPLGVGDDPLLEKAMDDIVEQSSPEKKKQGVFVVKQKERPTWVESRKERMNQQRDYETNSQLPVCTIALLRFTVDWQRIFKDERGSDARSQLFSPERSQMYVIIHNVQIHDNTINSPYPIVFDSSSPVSFFDLCVRLRGSLGADLVKVDLIDLNLAHANGKSEKISIKTSEEFVWKVLDVANRILVATAELAGVDMKLEWNEEAGTYEVIVADISNQITENMRYNADYTPPRTDRLYDISRARVSPFSVVVTFKRQPQTSRYKLVNKGAKGAKLVNYFTTRLKFTLEKAELKFARYDARNIKGPLNRLLEELGAVYVTRLKLKVVSILSATNFQDWKFLASRDEGDDEFVEGDLLRVTGNIAGNTADYIVKKVGQGLSSGVRVVTHSLGDGIESATGKVGARAVGAGVNSVVSGIGDGVGETLKGVGTGAGKVLKGAGKGVGHIVGGATGAVLLAGKGIGKGVRTGDGKAVVEGFSSAAVSVGSGVGQGVESAVMGAADGFMAVGQGLFSGVKNVGKGVGSAFTGGKKKKPYR